MLLKSKCNMSDRKRLNSKALRVTQWLLQNIQDPFVWVIGEGGVFPRAAEPLQSWWCEGLLRKAPSLSVSGTCLRQCRTWWCIIYVIVLWGLWIPQYKKLCMTHIYFFSPLLSVKFRKKDALKAEMLAELHPITRVLYIKQKRIHTSTYAEWNAIVNSNTFFILMLKH